VENVKGEEEGGVVRREVGREREDQALVPGGFASAGVVGAGGGAAGGVEVGDDVGAELAAAPVDVLQVLARDDGELQIEGLERCRGGQGHGRGWSLELGVSIRGRLVLVRVERGGGRRW
jgi:hypothetical protein